VHYLARYETGIGPVGRQMLDRVSGAGQRLVRLFDELELVPWIGGDAPRPTLTRELCRPDALVEAALARAGRAARQYTVALHADVPDDLPAIEGNPAL